MKLLIADDHTLFRDILTIYLEKLNKGYDVTLAKDMTEAFKILKKNKKQRFDLVILDLCMPGMGTFEGLKRVKKMYPEQSVAIISGVAQPWEVGQSIQHGASAFFPKSMPGKALVHAIDLVLSGEKFVPIEYMAPPVHNPPKPLHVLHRLHGPDHHYELTDRENEVLQYLMRGASNQDIADDLDLQTITIKQHVRNICRKLGAKNRTQAALFARELNIVKS